MCNCWTVHLKKRWEADARYLLSIEPDGLLADFREHAGLKAKSQTIRGLGNHPACRAYARSLFVGLFHAICLYREQTLSR